jgi:hypothetical protein
MVETKSTERSNWSLCKSMQMCVSKEKWLGGSPSFPPYPWSSTGLSSIIFNDSIDSVKVSCVPQQSSNVPASDQPSGMHQGSTPASLLTSISAFVYTSSIRIWAKGLWVQCAKWLLPTTIGHWLSLLAVMDDCTVGIIAMVIGY